MATMHSTNLATLATHLVHPIPGATPAVVTMVDSTETKAYVTDFMTKTKTFQQILPALRAFDEKKAVEACVLQMDLSTGAFTDFMLIASGSNPRQVQAIADAVEANLKKVGNRVNHVEGYNQAEWIMLDYVDFVVCVFSERARRYYDLERLWKSAQRMSVEEVMAAAKPKAKAKPAVVAKVPAKASAIVATKVVKVAKAPAKKAAAVKTPKVKAAKPRVRKPSTS